MLQGEWPGDGCEYCQNIEMSGGHSDRNFQNLVPNIYPSELDEDPACVKVQPRILEVFFSNTCNFKCVYCKGKFSSSIQQEDKKFGGSLIHLQQTDTDNRYKEYIDTFWAWFKNHSSKLDRLQVLGGEPFLVNDVALLLDYFESNAHPNLEFNIVTNLGVPSKLVSSFAQRMASLLRDKKLGRVDIQVSIDAWGPAQEYVRHGLDLSLFEKNLSILLQEKIFRIGLLSTVCSLTIHEMPDLAKKYLDWGQQQEIFWYMHLVLPTGSSLFDPGVFDYEIFKSSLEKTLAAIPNDTWDRQQTRNTLQGIMRTIEKNSVNAVDKQSALRYFLEKNDQRRNSCWQIVFPWLNKESSDVV